MKNVYITIKNFYTQAILKQKSIKTESKTLKELIKEINYNIQEFIILDEINNMFISENNELENNSRIVLINADGQIKK